MSPTSRASCRSTRRGVRDGVTQRGRAWIRAADSLRAPRGESVPETPMARGTGFLKAEIGDRAGVWHLVLALAAPPPLRPVHSRSPSPGMLSALLDFLRHLSARELFAASCLIGLLSLIAIAVPSAVRE